MREIKFRAWDEKHKVMFEVMDIDFVIKNVECYKDKKKEGCIHAKFGFKKVEIMQFTGLKDKNGKEIFEGDILEIKYQKLKYYVKWDNFNGFIVVSSSKSRNYFSKELMKHIEVIGNIYENPELLGGRK